VPDILAPLQLQRKFLDTFLYKPIIVLHINLCSGSHTDKCPQTDMTKATGALRVYEVPKMVMNYGNQHSVCVHGIYPLHLLTQCNNISPCSICVPILCEWQYYWEKELGTLYIYIYIHVMDPHMCHEDSGMWRSNKYTNLQCKILLTFYKNSIINHLHTHKNSSTE
jgi:hypothetical protein